MRKLILPLFFGILGTVVLVSLGTWQLQRMVWKEAVLDDIALRISSAPVNLPTQIDPENDQYLPVVAQGTFTTDELHLLASTRDVGAVYRIITAFETEDGRRIMVDRGWVKTQFKDVVRGPVGGAVVGNLQWPKERDSFTPQNDVDANIWFARDVPQMAAVLNAEPVLLVQREKLENSPTITPLPVDNVGIPNNHLEYVITWFGLAIVWVAMTLYYLLRMRKTKKAQNP